MIPIAQVKKLGSKQRSLKHLQSLGDERLRGDFWRPSTVYRLGRGRDRDENAVSEAQLRDQGGGYDLSIVLHILYSHDELRSHPPDNLLDVSWPASEADASRAMMAAQKP
eukprot:gnl/TRDRNA2_/TRDRNA2_175585_c12_seq3.p1 gnl/TRDRNA2_/TRDRNA2_175585_c12~~gnl/TRDRNA2_/TRDRNA2_175585_c12_seq3.p1  ORF type:complete len:110 (-),score=11.71 gnl/TRDRNA2_/TRDRNA2_175585_c12_seq3:53-382(-)